jgi:hypothetical protein
MVPPSLNMLPSPQPTSHAACSFRNQLTGECVKDLVKLEGDHTLRTPQGGYFCVEPLQVSGCGCGGGGGGGGGVGVEVGWCGGRAGRLGPAPMHGWRGQGPLPLCFILHGQYI